MALQERTKVALWARRAASVEQATERGIGGATDDLAEAIAGADLILLSVPVGAMRGLTERMLGLGLAEDCLVTDVGSVKTAVHRELGPLLGNSGVPLIGGHPMAGSERQGIEACRADLFQGAACLLTNDEGVEPSLALRLEKFWQAVGCRVSWIDARSHDELVARISHFPHAMAAVAALVSLESPEEAVFGGGGLRDTTRVAGGDAGMWAEILMENRASLLGPMRSAMSILGEMLAMLEGGEHEAVRKLLERAKQLHGESRSLMNNNSPNDSPTDMSSHFAIAIDGPAASGKSTLAQQLSKRLGLVMVNSGAMYRAVTWKLLADGVEISNPAAVAEAVARMQIDCGVDGLASTVAINGVDPGDALRSEEVNLRVSMVAAVPEVRERLVDLQRNYLENTDVVMEGRDIGSVVFPDTAFKIYVDADTSVRMQRREEMGEVDAVEDRDREDSTRKTAPLKVAEGAMVLDTSEHSIESGVDAAMEILRSQGLKR